MNSIFNNRYILKSLYARFLIKNILWHLLIIALTIPAPVSAAQEGNKFSRVGVMSFKNLSANAADEWLCEAIAEMIAFKLTQSQNVGVIERQRLNDILKQLELSQYGLLEGGAKTPELGKLLPVNHLVFGSLQTTPEEIQITARLVSVETAKVEASAAVQGARKDIFKIQGEIAEKLLASIEKAIAPDKREEQDDGKNQLEAYKLFGGALVLKREGSLAAADAEFEKADKLYPKFVENLVQWGDNKLTQGENAKALELFSRSEKLMPDNSLILIYKSLALRSLNLRAEAFEMEKKASELKPNDPDILYWYGSSLAWQGRLSEAEEVMRKASLLYELNGNQRALVWTYAYTGGLLIKQGQPEKAKNWLEKSKKLAVEPEIKGVSIYAPFRMNVIAKRIFNSIDVMDMAMVAHLLKMLGAPKEGLPYLEEAQKRDPNNAHIKINFADSYLFSSEYKKASEIYAAIIERLKDAPDEYINGLVSYAIAEAKQENKETAQKLTTKIKRFAVENPAVALLAAKSFSLKTLKPRLDFDNPIYDLEAAIEILELVCKKEGYKNQDRTFFLLTLLKETGKLETGRKILEAAIKNFPQSKLIKELQEDFKEPAKTGGDK